MDEKLTNLIIKELGKHRSRNELIRIVCEKGVLNWAEAERLVKQIEEQHRRNIAARQSPLLLIFSFGMLIIGTGLLVYNIQFFIDLIQMETFDQILSLRTGYYKIASSLTGFGMIAGGMIGVWKTLIPLFGE